MSEQSSGVNVTQKRGADDSGKYFRYMAEFVGMNPVNIATIRKTKPIIEKHLPIIVGEFYEHLLRYPPTRKFFLKKDGSLDIDYIELRMRHLSNFWVRTADAVFDEDYARYVDYIGRAHTSHGADPHIYIAERYVIGQVGFMQRAINQILIDELHGQDDDLEHQAIEAWDKLMMVLLEMLSRAYNAERQEETYDPLVSVDQTMVAKLATHAFEHEFCQDDFSRTKSVFAGKADEISDGERKIVKVDNVSIGVFHHQGEWYALRNSCLHRGGPIATGELQGDRLICPWHGYEYNLTNGELLADPSAKLAMYPVSIQNGEVYIQYPDSTNDDHNHNFSEQTEAITPDLALAENEFRLEEVAPGKMKLVFLGEDSVAVYNVGGQYFATQSLCPHMGGELTEGHLEGNLIVCPIHASQFRISDGAVLRGPSKKALKTYRIMLDGSIGRVLE